jgi:hypothetical protein
MSASPRCRSTLGLAESPSPISHVESTPPDTTDTRLNDCIIDKVPLYMKTFNWEDWLQYETIPDIDDYVGL